MGRGSFLYAVATAKSAGGQDPDRTIDRPMGPPSGYAAAHRFKGW